MNYTAEVKRMNMFRFITVTLTMLLLVGCKPLNLSNQIAVVDLNTVAKALGRDDAIVKNVKTANDKLNQQLEQITADVQKQLETEKTKLGEKPSKEKEQKFIQLVQQANNQLSQTKQVAIQKSQQLQNSLVAEFRNEVSNISQEIAQENGYLTVLAINDGLLWVDATVDITSEVITKMRYSTYEKSTKDDMATRKN
ncbi:MAG: OmpH family outer membrane protein [Gammaproteobacteria bacterium]|nr:OmpH family outer membrane protein [Gammaproteobacteria bacterium]